LCGARLFVVVRVLHGGARLLQVVGWSAHRSGTGLSGFSGGVRWRGEWRAAAFGAVRAAAALECGERGELCAACSWKSYEQVELLLAVRFPKPDLRDLIRRLPMPPVSTPDMGSEQIEVELGAPSAEVIAEPSLPRVPMVGGGDRSPARRGTVKPLSVDRFSVNFTADGEFHELLGEVRALLSHAEPQAKLAPLAPTPRQRSPAARAQT
jgi:hypothetical protein